MREGRRPTSEPHLHAAARDSGARRRFVAALAFSLGAHGLLLAGFLPREWDRGSAQADRAGFRNAAVDAPQLNPPDPFPADQERLASARRSAGALVETPVDPAPAAATADLRVHPRPGEAGADPISIPVIELSEDWSLRSTHGPTARSSRFVIRKMVRPSYPEIAIHAGVEGTIRLQAGVDRSGRVTGVQVLESQVDRSCEDETVRALRGWEFEPYVIDGRPTEFTVIVPFRFRLE